jgi:hypothetical protein
MPPYVDESNIGKRNAKIVAKAKKACQQSDRRATEVSLHGCAFVILTTILTDAD